MPGTIPKQPAFTRQTLKDVCNKYESVFHSLNSPVNFHLKLTEAISFWKLGVVHGPRSMFCVRLVEERCFKFWSRKSEVWSLKSEVGSRKSEVGSRKSLLGFRTIYDIAKPKLMWTVTIWHSHFVHTTPEELENGALFLRLGLPHSRLQSPQSFWPVAGIEGSG